MPKSQAQQIFHKILSIAPLIKTMNSGESIQLTSKNLPPVFIEIIKAGSGRIDLSLKQYSVKNVQILEQQMTVALFPESKTGEGLSYKSQYGLLTTSPQSILEYPKAKKEINYYLNSFLNTLKINGYGFSSEKSK